ncbi:hypothetical protein QCD70_14395 [Agreia sp. PsM10]|uniref:hypothetical protein n=1 Tax=Agreia sp. PsM10 TaxID=3030533 RepID=UPI00263B7E0A|nr:hypothetical protein [Agreia sp. PsM10]MDN4641443.1 hypothetical protein [Agreia sp. PsM10]
MADVDDWARNLRAEDLTVNGLARLEAELFKDYHDVQSSIRRVVGEFAPVARGIEQRHDGRRLMAPVLARQNQDVRQSEHFLLSLVSFMIVALPAVAWGISLRGSYDYMTTVSTAAVLLALTAALCIIKVLSTLRDRVWVGVMTHWAMGAAVVTALTLAFNLYVASQVSDPEVGAPLTILMVSALVVVGFGILALVRHAGAARALRTDLADVQPAVNAYLGELMPKYKQALGQIQDAVKTIDVPGTVDPKVQKRLRNQRNGVLAVLINKGLYQGQVPLRMSEKALGEFQLYEVVEPLLGGGPYPKQGKPSRETALSS